MSPELLVRGNTFAISRYLIHGTFAELNSKLGAKEMRKINSIYWVVTVFAGVFMLLGAIPDVLQVPGALALITHLGYPGYLLPFLGVAKILGVGALFIPRFTGVKEWAYAGLIFDLLGAFYSHISVGDGPAIWIFPIVGILLVSSSYLLRRRKLNEQPIRELRQNVIRAA